MATNGKARVLTPEQFQYVLTCIEEHRHPEKNRLIMELSFKLALRVQEISLLRIREVAEIGAQYASGFKIKDVLVLPKSFTKGARASKTKAQQPRKSVRFSLAEFDQVVAQIKELAKSGQEVNPSLFYPLQKKNNGKTREIPLVDRQLINAIKNYLQLRLVKNPNLKLNHPLILNQKNKAYSPNSLQEHMALMMRNWSGIERARSHSGRRSLATHLIHNQGEHLKTVQQLLGHKDPSTTVIYHELPEDEMKKVIAKSGKAYQK